MGTCIDKPTIECTPHEYTSLMSINLESAFHCNQLAHPLLKASGNGSIVFISSVAGVVALGPSIYGMTKGTTVDTKHNIVFGVTNSIFVVLLNTNKPHVYVVSPTLNVNPTLCVIHVLRQGTMLQQLSLTKQFVIQISIICDHV